MQQQTDQFTITWAGDLLLGDGARGRLERHGHTWPFTHLLPHLAADYLIGNQEGPITQLDTPHFPDQRWSYNADPAAATALAEVGFNAMSLANNHTFDRGPEGLADTIAHLRSAGITPFGAGPTAAEAAAPLLVPTPFGVVAVLGQSYAFRSGYSADADTPGTIPLTRATIAAGADAARAAGARWVIGFVHWGENYVPVTDRQRRRAADFAAAGYDLVIGTGPHYPQPMDIVAGTPVLYSIGNSVFGSGGRFASFGVPGHGLLVTTVFTAHGLERIDVTCIANDNKIVRYRPRPTAPEGGAYEMAWTGCRATIPIGRREPVGLTNITHLPLKENHVSHA